MNILVITPIHPIYFTEFAINCYKHYENSNAEIFSLQTMAMLAEQSRPEQIVYPVANQMFAKILENNGKILKKSEDKKHLIVIGNISKSCNIKFDYILSFKENYLEEEPFDKYLEIMIEKFKDIETINWYEKEDAEFHFTEKRHLYLFLKQLGVTE